MARTRDMTTGSPTKHILLFCLPIIAGNAFQQLYSLVDTFVVGNAEGVTALTAVASAGWLDWLVLSLAIGLAQGFCIQIAQSFGAGDLGQMRRAVGQSLLLSVVTVAVVEVVAQLCLWPVLQLLQTPEETIELTCLYLRIIFAGMPVVMGFNLFGGFLRSVGNSTTPLYAMVAASLVNMGLDVLFVVGFRWGVAGAALATVISQTISCLVCLTAVLRLPQLHVDRADLRPDLPMCRRLMKLGLPISFQNVVISIGGLVMQRVVNGFGFIFVAGFNAASRLVGLIELAGVSVGNAVGTFAGQNLGAGRIDRVKLGLRRAAQISVALALLVALSMLFFGKPLLGLFIEDQNPEMVAQVLQIAYRYLMVMSAGLPMLYLLFTYRTTLQGIGDTMIPMVSGFVELAMRIGGVLALPMVIGEWGVYIAEIMAWIGAAILLMWGYYHRIRRLAGSRGA